MEVKYNAIIIIFVYSRLATAVCWLELSLGFHTSPKITCTSSIKAVIIRVSLEDFFS